MMRLDFHIGHYHHTMAEESLTGFLACYLITSGNTCQNSPAADSVESLEINLLMSSALGQAAVYRYCTLHRFQLYL